MPGVRRSETVFGEWLASSGTSPLTVQAALGCGLSTVYEWAAGRFAPGARYGWAIADLSGGAVPYDRKTWPTATPTRHSPATPPPPEHAFLLAQVLADYQTERDRPAVPVAELAGWADTIAALHREGCSWGSMQKAIDSDLTLSSADDLRERMGRGDGR